MASKRSSHIEPIVTIDSRVLPVGIVGIDGAGAVVSWNPAAEEILGWRSDEVVGRPPPVEFPAEGIEQNVTLQRKDGSGADVQVKNLGTFVIICDLGTHREESRFRELLELAPDAIIEIDPDGRIVLLNEATQTLFGYERNELLGQPVEILIPGELRAEHRGFRKDYAKRPATRPMGSGLSLEGLRKDGARIPVEISLSPKRSKGGVRVTAIIRDVRERLRLTGFEEFDDTRQTGSNVGPSHTTGVEGTHGQLSTGLADRLRGDDADGVAGFAETSRSGVEAVTQGTQTGCAAALQR